jgi:small-conductance mechanosensitive channel
MVEVGAVGAVGSPAVGAVARSVVAGTSAVPLRADGLAVLDGVSGLGRVVVSVLVLAVVVGVRYLARRWRRTREDDQGGDRSVPMVAVAGLVALVTAGGVVALVATWGLWGQLSDAVTGLGDESTAGKLLVTGVLIGGAYALTNFVGRVIGELSRVAGVVSRHQREIIYRLTQVSIYAAVGLAVLGLFTNDPSSLLVGAGFLGIVVGMAARQTLGSVLAGFVLMLSRPFEIGDWIEVGGHEGTVSDITVVNTRIQTFDGEHVVVPNDVVGNESVVNRSRKGRLRIEVEVGVDYAVDVERAVAVAEDAVASLEGERLLSVPSPQVVVKRFDDSAVTLGVRGWIDNPSARRRWRARTAVVGAVKAAFDDAGVKIPFPQRELAGRAETGGLRVGPGREASEADVDREADVDGAGEAERPADRGRATADGGDGGSDADADAEDGAGDGEARR